MTSNVRSRSEFVELINTELKKGPESIIRTGQLFIEAKDELPHGEFGKMWLKKEVHVGQRMAQKYMAIAANRTLTSIANRDSHLLPSSVNTLHLLAVLPEEQLAERHQRGEIVPELQTKRVERWLKEAQRDRDDLNNLQNHIRYILDFTLSYPEPNRPLARILINRNAEDGITGEHVRKLKDWFGALYDAHLGWERERQERLAEHETMKERVAEKVLTRVEANRQLASIEDVIDDDDIDDDEVVGSNEDGDEDEVAEIVDGE
jgi:hypothetical protein